MQVDLQAPVESSGIASETLHDTTIGCNVKVLVEYKSYLGLVDAADGEAISPKPIAPDTSALAGHAQIEDLAMLFLYTCLSRLYSPS